MVKPKNNGSSGGSSSSNSSSNSSSSSSSSSSNATAKTTKKKQKTTQDPSKAPDLILKSLMRQLPLPSSNGRDFKLFNANSISQQSRRSAVRTYAELSSKQRPGVRVELNLLELARREKGSLATWTATTAACATSVALSMAPIVHVCLSMVQHHTQC